MRYRYGRQELQRAVTVDIKLVGVQLSAEVKRLATAGDIASAELDKAISPWHTVIGVTALFIVESSDTDLMAAGNSQFERMVVIHLLACFLQESVVVERYSLQWDLYSE